MPAIKMGRRVAKGKDAGEKRLGIDGVTFYKPHDCHMVKQNKLEKVCRLIGKGARTQKLFLSQ